MKKLYGFVVIIGLIFFVSLFLSCKFETEKEKEIYTVKYTTEYGKCPATISVEDGTILSDNQLPDLVADSYGVEFEGWFDSDGIRAIAGKYKVSKNITLVAKWNPKSYIVSFETNGGTSLSSQKIIHGNTAKQPDTPIKEGSEFIGWFKDELCTIPFNFSTPIKENIILYAKWNEYFYIITYETNGGNVIESQTVKYGDIIDKPDNPTKEGYSFLGWFTDELLLKKFDFSVSIKENKTIYAKWKINTYIVSFETNGPESINEQTVIYGENATEPPQPQRNGFEFGGWYTNADFTELFNFDKPIINNVTIYVKWLDNEPPAEVTDIIYEYNKENNILKVSWKDPVSKECYGSPVSHVLITYSPDNKNDYIQNIELVEKGIQQVIIQNMQTDKEFYYLTIYTVEEMGNRSNGTNIKVSLKNNNARVPVNLAAEFIKSLKESTEVHIIGKLLADDIYGTKIIESIYNLKKNIFIDLDLLETEGVIFNANGSMTRTFSGCSSLRTIILPDSVTSIEYEAFRNCSSLESITIPDSITSIGRTAFCGCSSLKDITIPDGVTCIEGNTFYGCTSLESITIPDSVTSIEYGAFENCTSLESITIPDSVTSIGNGAFYGCTSLKSITIPDGVTCIESGTFSGCSSLKSINIPDSITSIEHNAFENCTSLECFTIPDSVTCIKRWIFKGCTNLESLTIPDSVISIEYGAFESCSSLESLTIPDSVTSIEGGVFRNCSSLKSITIPDGVTCIESGTFSGCSSLESVIIPNSVTRVDYRIFSGCSSLKTLSIPLDLKLKGEPRIIIYLWELFETADDSKSYYSVNYNNKSYYIPYSLKHIIITKGKIERKAFNSWRNLETITIQGNVTICDYAFESNWNLKLVEIGEGVISIGNYAFQKCIYLISVKLGEGITSFGEHVFYGCSNLKKIEISKGVTSIGYGAFVNCSSLKNITIPDSVTSIGGSAFFGCSSLESITIPDSVTSIGNRAFYGCSSLRSIIIPASVTSIGYTIFENCSNITDITLPCTWKSFDYENKKSNYIVFGDLFGTSNYECSVVILQNEKEYYIPSQLRSVTINGGKIKSHAFYFKYYSLDINIAIQGNVTSIGEQAFYDCPNLTSINISGSRGVSIGSSAFYNCTKLSEAKITGNSISVDDRAFYSCSSLKSISLSGNLTSIGDRAFYNCKRLTDIDIPDSVTSSVTSIGESAFYECSSLKKIDIPDSVTSIGEKAFYNCCSLTSICIPSSVSSIGPSAFQSCKSLESITIPDGVACIERSTFYGCSSLKSITIPDSVTSIGPSAFLSCKSLESIIIPDSVASIGDHAFNGCSSLKSITIPDGVTCIEHVTFAECSSLENITIPDSVTSIGYLAFWECSSLKSITIPDSVTSIGDLAFNGCSSLKSITVPDSVTSIGHHAFAECSNLISIHFDDTVSIWRNDVIGNMDVSDPTINRMNFETYKDYAFYKLR